MCVQLEGTCFSVYVPTQFVIHSCVSSNDTCRNKDTGRHVCTYTCIYMYVIGWFPVVFWIHSASSAVLEGSKIVRGVGECYFPSKAALRMHLTKYT